MFRMGKTVLLLAAVGVAASVAKKMQEDNEAIQKGILTPEELKYEKEIEREYHKNRMKRKIRSLGK